MRIGEKGVGRPPGNGVPALAKSIEALYKALPPLTFQFGIDPFGNMPK